MVTKTCHFLSSILLSSLCILFTLGCSSTTVDVNSSASIKVVKKEVLRGQAVLVDSVAFSLNKQMLAAANLGSPKDDVVQLWDLDQPDAQAQVFHGHTDVISKVTFSPDGNSLASASDDKTVRLWDISHPAAPPTVLTVTSPAVSVAFGPDGQMLAAGTLDKLYIWNRPQFNVLVDLTNDTNMTQALAFSPDGQTVAFNSYASTIKLLNVHNLQAPPVILVGHETNVISVVFSPDGQRLASTSYDGRIYLWNMQKPGDAPTILYIRPEGADPGQINLAYVTKSIAFSPDGLILASGSDDGTLRLWQTNNLTAPPLVIDKEVSPIESVTWNHDGTLLAAASNRYVHVWQVSQSTPVGQGTPP